jgi:hypothetical protein
MRPSGLAILQYFVVTEKIFNKAQGVTRKFFRPSQLHSRPAFSETGRHDDDSNGNEQQIKSCQQFF